MADTTQTFLMCDVRFLLVAGVGLSELPIVAGGPT